MTLSGTSSIAACFLLGDNLPAEKLCLANCLSGSSRRCIFQGLLLGRASGKLPEDHRVDACPCLLLSGVQCHGYA